nr:hypothetical protein [Synergistaceae bacterium]
MTLEYSVEQKQQLRNSNIDIIVEKLAKNGGISLKAARKVYLHVFIEEHDLEDGIRRFDPSYDIAQSFQRLLDDKNIQKHDLILLHHEWLEAGIIKRYGYKYRIAYDITERKYNYGVAADEWKERGKK